MNTSDRILFWFYVALVAAGLYFGVPVFAWAADRLFTPPSTENVTTSIDAQRASRGSREINYLPTGDVGASGVFGYLPGEGLAPAFAPCRSAVNLPLKTRMHAARSARKLPAMAVSAGEGVSRAA